MAGPYNTGWSHRLDHPAVPSFPETAEASPRKIPPSRYEELKEDGKEGRGRGDGGCDEEDEEGKGVVTAEEGVEEGET